MKNKAQTAMEYLMTYGWAILIIIVVIAALYAMGVFTTPGGTIPCSPCFTYFAYEDHDETNLYLTNGARDITLGGIDYAAGDPITYAHGCGTYAAGTWPCSLTITYTTETSGGTPVNHTDTGKIHALA